MSPSGYDLVVLGVSVWDIRVPPAMRTYLNRNDLSKKKIALFCTNEGSSAENTLSSPIALARNQNPLAQLVVSKVLKNSKQEESKVENWCKELCVHEQGQEAFRRQGLARTIPHRG